MENSLYFSILLSISGIIVGIITMILITHLRLKGKEVKSKNILELAEKSAEKIKREKILEAKEETYKLKMDAERTAKEKKNEVREAEID